jgi:secreted Zn-dependent insulinase-like peptidase
MLNIIRVTRAHYCCTLCGVHASLLLQAQRHWSEVKAMCDMNFRFAQEAPPFAYAPNLARRLQMYPPSEVQHCYF